MDFKKYISRKEIVKKENEKYGLDIDYRLVADESKLFKNYEDAYNYLIEKRKEFLKDKNEFEKRYEKEKKNILVDKNMIIEYIYSVYKIRYFYGDCFKKSESYFRLLESLNLQSFQKENVKYNNDILKSKLKDIYNEINEFKKEYIIELLKYYKNYDYDYDYIYDELIKNDKYSRYRNRIIRNIEYIVSKDNTKNNISSDENLEDKKTDKSLELRNLKREYIKNFSKANSEKAKAYRKVDVTYGEKFVNGKISYFEYIYNSNIGIPKEYHDIDLRYKDKMYSLVYSILKNLSKSYDKNRYSNYFNSIYSDDFKDEKTLNEVLRLYNENYINIVDRINSVLEKHAKKQYEVLKEKELKKIRKAGNNKKYKNDVKEYLDYEKFSKKMGNDIKKLILIDAEYIEKENILDDILEYMKVLGDKIYGNILKILDKDIIDFYNFGYKIQMSLKASLDKSMPSFVSVASNIGQKPRFKSVSVLVHEMGHAITDYMAEDLLIGSGSISSTHIIKEMFSIFFEKLFLSELLKDIENNNNNNKIKYYVFMDLDEMIIRIKEFNSMKVVVDNILEYVRKDDESLDNIEDISKKYIEKLREVTNENEEILELKQYGWILYYLDKPYNEIMYLLGNIIAINMVMKLEENNEYTDKIYEAIKNMNRKRLYEILEILDISLTEDITYDNILKYIDRLSEYITEGKKEP